MKRSLAVVGVMILLTCGEGLCKSLPEARVENPLKVRIYAPRMEYPYQARALRLTGSGKFLMRVHIRTGLVAEVTMVKSTGHNILDEAASRALRQWRFKPGALTPAKVQNPKHKEPWAAEDSLIYFPVNFTVDGT